MLIIFKLELFVRTYCNHTTAIYCHTRDHHVRQILKSDIKDIPIDFQISLVKSVYAMSISWIFLVLSNGALINERHLAESVY